MFGTKKHLSMCGERSCWSVLFDLKMSIFLKINILNERYPSLAREGCRNSPGCPLITSAGGGRTTTEMAADSDYPVSVHLSRSYPSKHDTLNKCSFIVGPTTETLG